VRGERGDQRMATRLVGLGGARKEPAARWIRPERPGQLLQEVTHPSHADRLPALQPRNRYGVTGHDGNAEIGAEPLRGRPHDRPVFPTLRQRHERRARYSCGIVDLDQQRMRTATQHRNKVRGPLVTDGGASWILRTRRQHDGGHPGPKRALQRIRPGSVIVDAERRRYQAERCQQIEQRRKGRVLDGNAITRLGVFA